MQDSPFLHRGHCVPFDAGTVVETPRQIVRVRSYSSSLCSVYQLLLGFQKSESFLLSKQTEMVFSLAHKKIVNPFPVCVLSRHDRECVWAAHTRASLFVL